MANRFGFLVVPGFESGLRVLLLGLCPPAIYAKVQQKAHAQARTASRKVIRPKRVVSSSQGLLGFLSTVEDEGEGDHIKLNLREKNPGSPSSNSEPYISSITELQKWRSQRTTLRTTSLTRLTKMASRSPASTATPPPKG